jgi:DNA-binding NtrC family response regulator
MAHILVVDDETRIRQAVTRLLEHHHHRVTAVESGEAAIAKIGADPADVAILDINLPGIDGVETLRQIRAKDPDTLVIFMTAFASVRSAVDAMKAGGFDYLTKPFDNDDLLITIERAVRLRSLDKRVVGLEADLHARTVFSGIVGQSPALLQVLRSLAKVSQTNTTVLLLGESGTGKELAARSLHRQSPRANGPFVAINCGAIPAALAESELFGHEKGAFTDARETRAGKWEQANGGTIFLDEVGELSPEVQTKLLRVIQEREVTRVGGRSPIPVDVRIVAATNRDLEAAVAAGHFRDDLYWRLNTFPIALPMLRERVGDLPILINHLLDVLNAELGLAVTGVSDAAMYKLTHHTWPGNVRELANVLRRAMIVTETSTIGVDDLLLTRRAATPSQADESVSPTAPLADVVARATDRIERAMIETAMAECLGNRSAAAERLGLHRRTLFSKMRRLHLTTDEDDKD